jgi:hypothetical protein
MRLMLAFCLHGMRNMTILTFSENVISDIRYGVRSLRRTPILAWSAVLSLALGIGSSTVAFSVLDALVFKPLPVKAPNELVSLEDVAAAARSDSFS